MYTRNKTEDTGVNMSEETKQLMEEVGVEYFDSDEGIEVEPRHQKEIYPDFDHVTEL